jgi:hypothetical protein
VDARSGVVRAVYTVPGAVNHDWEDLAVARDAAGRPWLWLADIGDNLANRAEVQLYRVPEPHVDMHARDRLVATARPQVERLRYPSGPVDAESLAVAPGGHAYIVTKTQAARSEVYAVPPRAGPNRVQLLRRVGALAVPVAHASALLPGRLARLTTGAAISPDGRLLAVRSYLDAFVWRLGVGGVASALRHAPTTVSLPLQRQGEGVCVVGTRLVVDSEGRGSPVWSVPLPAALVADPATPSAAPSTAPTSPLSTSPSPSASRSRTVPKSGAPVGVLVLVVVAVIGAVGAWRALGGRRHRE